LAELPIPAQVHNWIVNYLSNRGHCTRYKGEVSAAANIDASIVQGSVIGPMAFVINNSALKAIHDGNLVPKYADDTCLVAPSVNTHTIQSELDHISSWAGERNLTLNIKKTFEIIFYRQRRGDGGGVDPPALLPGIARVEEMELLGIWFPSKLSFDLHFDKILTRASQSMYALRVLRTHGLQGKQLWDITAATLISNMLYASPLWWGYASSEYRNRFEAVLRKLKKVGFLPLEFRSFESLCVDADSALFMNILNNRHHVLHPLLPPVKPSHYYLRPRKHNRVIIKYDNRMLRNFIPRQISEDSY